MAKKPGSKGGALGSGGSAVPTRSLKQPRRLHDEERERAQDGNGENEEMGGQKTDEHCEGEENRGKNIGRSERVRFERKGR